MRRVLYDTNVVLDVLQARRPHLAASAAALNLVEAGRVEGYVAAHAITTIAYLLQRQVGAARSRVVLADLLSRLQVAAVTERTIRTALAGAFRDVEDAVCHAAALEARAELIVTRNLADFVPGTVPAVLPETPLAALTGQARRGTPPAPASAEARRVRALPATLQEPVRSEPPHTRVQVRPG